MYCFVCESRHEHTDVSVCTSCAKVLCADCRAQHDQVFGFAENHHKVADVCGLLKFFRDPSLKEKKQCKNNHDAVAEYLCESCDELSCVTCLHRHHRQHRARKLENFAPQIKSALNGCNDMLQAKGSQFNELIENLKKQELSLEDEMKRHDDVIKKTSKELLFRIAVALRKQETSFRKIVTSQYTTKLQQVRGQIDTTRSFVEVSTLALDVVRELSNEIPLQKDLFTNLGLINKLDTSYVIGSHDNQKQIQKPFFQRPSDHDVDVILQQLFKLELETDDVIEKSVNQLVNKNQTMTSPVHQPQPVNQNITSRKSPEKFLHQKKLRHDRNNDVDSDVSVGETDEEFGEFRIQGVLNEVTQTRHNQSYKPIYNKQTRRKNNKNLPENFLRQQKQNELLRHNNEETLRNNGEQLRHNGLRRTSVYDLSKPRKQIFSPELNSSTPSTSRSSSDASSTNSVKWNVIDNNRTWAKESSVKSPSYSDVNKERQSGLKSSSVGNISVCEKDSHSNQTQNKINHKNFESNPNYWSNLNLIPQNQIKLRKSTPAPSTGLRSVSWVSPSGDNPVKQTTEWRPLRPDEHDFYLNPHKKNSKSRSKVKIRSHHGKYPHLKATPL